jgi:toxin YoeB
MKHIEFVPKAFAEYQNWILNDRKIAIRIGDLVRNIL